eukprot:TRINITY_DN29779_c0_g1_i1.p1 TRINITY_DN29779_c0_g1~~TRINITY_DN29779_c0_g1_i1.p1  ORF type:complete len:450 (+),score=71.27 TRINITY_DN29779_c0_g1_i1:230-1579(+)
MAEALRSSICSVASLPEWDAPLRRNMTTVCRTQMKADILCESSELAAHFSPEMEALHTRLPSGHKLQRSRNERKTRRPVAPSWQCSTALRELETIPQVLTRNAERQSIRLALPSKGRMAEDTLELLKACQLTIRKPNPRQYIADVVEMEGLEVWFQRASDVVRKIRSGDVDLGIVGYDMVQEYGQDDEDLIIVHEALGFGSCHLAIAVPSYGIFENVSTLNDLMAMPQWTDAHPLRIVTGYTHLGKKFVEANGMRNTVLSTADGALEAAPAMGTADAILDLVSSGTTLRENNLKELKGARVLDSQGVLVASRKALLERKGTLAAAHEMLERLEAHLRARDRFAVTANMRGASEEAVAAKIWSETEFPGLQGPTISRVFPQENGGSGNGDYFSVTVVVPKSDLYTSIREFRTAGGSGVLVTPLTYIFDEEPPRWLKLLDTLGLDKDGLPK